MSTWHQALRQVFSIQRWIRHVPCPLGARSHEEETHAKQSLRYRMTREAARCVQNTVGTGTGCVEEVAFRLEKDPEAFSRRVERKGRERAQHVWGQLCGRSSHRRAVSGPGRRTLKAGLAFIWGHILRPREPPKVSEQRSDVSRSGSSQQRI